jgi:peptidoglycan hydrolase-like protein with peptidoglycan-binding domain
MPQVLTPTIPTNITVHLGPPSSNARNVTVPFVDYLKNVASSEIYPTWPENALRANIYAQISFALNRIYTEWYRSRGYDFDITNSTAYDQYFVEGRDYFDSVSQIVDEIFNNYLVRQGSIEPLFAQYCNGTTVTCDGLSQWGTVPLAQQGRTPYQILTYYYGNDINIVHNAPQRENTPSYPGTPLRLGASGNDVQRIQRELNRISSNYPAIDKIYPESGVFDLNTETSVRQFQEIFQLEPDGIVGKGTWYQLIRIFNAVKRLAELNSEGLTMNEVSFQYSTTQRLGDSGLATETLQYFLRVLRQYYHEIPVVVQDGYFGEQTRQGVLAAQRLFDLPQDGIAGPVTWNALLNAYHDLTDSQALVLSPTGAPLYQGRPLVLGMSGEDVRLLQTYLQEISRSYPSIPSVPITGYFGEQTRAAVAAFQELFGPEVTGSVGPVTWDEIASLYVELNDSSRTAAGQFPGYAIGGEIA